MRKIIIVFLLSILIVSDCYSQSNSQFLMRTEDGVAVVFNRDTYAYGVELIGKEIKPSEGGFIVVDKAPVNVSAVEWQMNSDSIDKDSAYEREVLLQHFNWEFNYIQDTLFQTKLECEKEFVYIKG